MIKLYRKIDDNKSMTKIIEKTNDKMKNKDKEKVWQNSEKLL